MIPLSRNFRPINRYTRIEIRIDKRDDDTAAATFALALAASEAWRRAACAPKAKYR